MKQLSNEELIALTENAIKELEYRVVEGNLERFDINWEGSDRSGRLYWSESTAECSLESDELGHTGSEIRVQIESTNEDWMSSTIEC